MRLKNTNVRHCIVVQLGPVYEKHYEYYYTIQQIQMWTLSNTVYCVLKHSLLCLRSWKSTLEPYRHCFIKSTIQIQRVTVQIPIDSTLYTIILPYFWFIELMHCFSIHYALSIVMAVWLDTYFFVWPQNDDADVFYNGLLLWFSTQKSISLSSALQWAGTGEKETI